MKQMLLIQIKMANLLAFLLLILDVFHKPTEGHCVLIPLLSVFKQADDYKDDDDDDGNDDSGLGRSSCRAERDADNRPVYSRKGTLRMFKMAAAGWQPTRSADKLMYRCENTLTERWSCGWIEGGVGGVGGGHLAGPETEAPKERAAEKGKDLLSSCRLFTVLTEIFSNLLELQMLRGSLWRRCCRRAKEVNASREREATSCWPSNVYKPPPLHLSHSSSLPLRKKAPAIKSTRVAKHLLRNVTAAESVLDPLRPRRAAGVLARDKMR